MSSAISYILYREDLLGHRHPLKNFSEDEDNSKALAERYIEIQKSDDAWPEDHKPILISSDREKWELTKDYSWREL